MWQYNKIGTLSHHGILGQKWGVRRFQNKDGTRTAAGKRREQNARKESDTSENRSKRQLDDRTKKVLKIGASAAAAALVVAGGYALYKSGKLDPALDKIVSYGKDKIPDIRNIGGNMADKLSRAVSSKGVKYAMLTRDFASEQKERVKEAGKKAITEYRDELVKSGMLAATGYAAKKLSDFRNEKEDDQVTDTLVRAGEKAIRKAEDSISNYSNTSSNKGASVGRETSRKLGTPTQERYSPQDETRYQAIFKNPKINGNVEARQTIKTLRKQGYDIYQIEKYVNMM